MKLDRSTLHDPKLASALEWLLADGLGGYAASTPLGLNSRRQHGLLVAASRAPLGRVLLLSRVDEALTLRDARHELASNAYAGAIHPHGYELAASWDLDPLPSLTWSVPGGVLSRVVARINGEPGALIAYRFEGEGPAWLELRPLTAFREHGALCRAADERRPAADWLGGDVVLRAPVDCPALHLRLAGGRFEADGLWYYQCLYARDLEQGLEAEEDLWSPGVFRLALASGETACLLAWAGPIPAGFDPHAALAAERRRLRRIGGGGHEGRGLKVELRRAADAFVVRRGERRSVLTGYPAPADGSREALIALPGLMLATDRAADARLLLAELARHERDGLLPSRFPEDGGEPEYRAADGALWFVLGVHRYLESTGDREFVDRELAPVVVSIVERHRHGTHHGIRVTESGLIEQGEPGTALTWMDARDEAGPRTPRHGLAVELQALWYNALLIGAEVARVAGAEARAQEWTLLASRARDAFVRAFWWEERGYLADVVADGLPDSSLRPNQLYAIGLPHALLPRDKALRVLDAVRAELLTPVGLRTLAPGDAGYCGDCGATDHAASGCHQGAAWPFLAGIYFDACIRLNGEQGKLEARRWLAAFEPQLARACLGSVGACFDGDAPHAARGAIAYAPSVAELLRLALRLGR